jgi:hypothetical protein
MASPTSFASYDSPSYAFPSHLVAITATKLLDHYLITLFVSFFVGYVVYQRLFAPLARVPGPFWAKLSKWWLIRRARNGDLHRELIRLHGIHGPLVRTAPDEV